jgi:hypothetical protein
MRVVWDVHAVQVEVGKGKGQIMHAKDDNAQCDNYNDPLNGPSWEQMAINCSYSCDALVSGKGYKGTGHTKSNSQIYSLE